MVLWYLTPKSQNDDWRNPRVADHPDRPLFEFTVDGESLTTSEHKLTADQILALAGIDPATHYLVEIHGHEQVPYKDRGGSDIAIHEHARFISNASGPTPLSWR
jgi:hypothetical protein